MRQVIPDWQSASDDTLYDIPGLDATPLRLLPRRVRYRLVNTGEIPVILIGRRRYLTRRAIREFLRGHEALLASSGVSPNKQP